MFNKTLVSTPPLAPLDRAIAPHLGNSDPVSERYAPQEGAPLTDDMLQAAADDGDEPHPDDVLCDPGEAFEDDPYHDAPGDLGDGLLRAEGEIVDQRPNALTPSIEYDDPVSLASAQIWDTTDHDSEAMEKWRIEALLKE